MLVRVNRQLIAVLTETEDFKRFSVAIDTTANDLTAVKDALREVGVLSDDGYMWVSESWLREASPHSSDEMWQQNLTAMINAVRKFGRIDEETGAIRAHVVWMDTPNAQTADSRPMQEGPS